MIHGSLDFVNKYLQVLMMGLVAKFELLQLSVERIQFCITQHFEVFSTLADSSRDAGEELCLQKEVGDKRLIALDLSTPVQSH